MNNFAPIIQILPQPDVKGNTLAMVKVGFNFLELITDECGSIYIPAGFIFDGASIPRFLWRVVGHPFNSRYITAACVHDYLYQTAKLSRRDSDRLFLCLLIYYNVNIILALLMFIAIRLFGKSNFKKKEK